VTALQRDVAGYCPMGCGETLALMADGHVTCRKLACPHPDSVSELLADSEAGHIVWLRFDDFTIRHPLRERLGDELLDCTLHADVAGGDGPPLPPGKYRVPAGATVADPDLWEDAGRD
jgi:Family of unknown function (DUF6085)